MDTRHYENEFEPTSIDELEYVRSPFYDLARIQHTKDGEEVEKLYDSIKMKYDILSPLHEVLDTQRPTKRNVAYKRYGDDQCQDPKWNSIFNFPKGKEYNRTSGSELFTVQKPENHNETLRTSKSFIADDYFSPHTTVGTGLNEAEFEPETILTIIPTLSHD